MTLIYFHSDCPSIISGSKLAYLEPQEKIWKGEAGKMFELADVYYKRKIDTLKPFQAVSQFKSRMSSFPGTIFRFPLRTTPSEISDNTYTPSQLRNLLKALRKEAKFLLLFLRSVINIEVYELNDSGRTLSFGISIQEQAAISHQRSQFMEQLSAAHASHSSGTSQPVQLLSEFHVNVSDQHSSEPEVSHWLVFTRVGSTNHEVLRLAQAQKTLPWVGAALELHPPHYEKYPTVQGGRIFCFLPMPIEASSPFPIHINGTFGLSDDRRSLKWSGPERQNDPTAKWNEIVVTSLLPQCYIELLMSAQKYLKHNEFYLAWPEVSKAKGTPWESLLRPFFTFLFCKDVVWTEKRQALQVVGEWILPRNGVFIPQGKTLPSVIHNALSNSNVKLVSIPPKVWAALQCSTISVPEVNPRFARNCLHMNKHSYASIDRIGKFEILRYCLSDRDYNDLQGLCLLPLADKISWVDIVRCSYYSTGLHYLCTGQCPAFLLPNQQHILVDVLEDEEVQSGLMAVARSGTTQLRELTAENVAQLLPKSFPGEWRSQQIVSVPHFQFPTDWFEKFWKWVGNKALSPFADQPLIPVRPVGSPPVLFQVARLNKKSNILYIPQHVPTPQELLSALDKLRLLYSKQVDFPFLAHVELTNYLAVFNSNGILDAINCSPHSIQQVSFSKEEANSMKVILVKPQPSLDASRQQTLQNLKLFTTMTNSRNKLCSVSECASSSLLKAAIRVPANFFLRIEYFPSNALIISDDYHQTVLLGLLQSRGLVTTPNNANFLLQYIFPLIPSKLGHNVLKSIMEDVLNQLPLIRREGYLPKIVSALKNLRFIEDKLGIFHSPSELYDPSINELQQLFLEEPVFPVLPFGEEKYLFHLRDCGLRQSVQPQDIVNIVSSIALPRAAVPQKVGTTKLSRARAVLKYISGCPPHLLQSQVTMPGYSGTYTFQSALHHFASNQSWLPVCSSPPQGYPQGLVWKGNLYNSHFVGLDNSTLVLSTQNSTSLPLIIGSQVYVVYTQVSSQTVKMFCMKESAQIMHVLTHFKEVIRIAEQVPAQVMDRFIHSMYNYLNVARQSGLQNQLLTLKSVPRWIWLKKQRRFTSPNMVAAEENETFPHKLEPYIFILPDELSQYTELFMHFGMPQCVSNSQIVSVLQSMKLPDQSMLNPEQTWGIVMSILNWLTKHGEGEANLPDGCTLYVPIESDLATPVLQDANEVVYTDNDYLKDYLASVETEQSFTCAHERIYPKLAHCLGLSSLSDYLDITEDTFEDAGQYEPLTVRLKNILRDYKDGLTIIKELIQNADDAEATEVNICYDARTIQVNSKALFFPGMADAHGPALVVHNNAVFSKDDMENITKLAGATKQDKPLKIGKFGIGFCSVYHITDVPSFVSQETLCVFDPTLSYLRKEIKNPARPGKRMKFTTKLLTTSKQLAPYNGLFGFSQKCAYQGTLFRFPFRTHISELSSTIYSEVMINDLQSEIFENSSKLLLFLQNVKKITFSRINQGDQSPTTLFEVEKSLYMVPPQAIMCTIERLYSHESTTKENWLVATESRVKLKSATASVACQLIKHSSSNLELTQPVQGEAFCFLPLALKTGLPVHISANFAVMNNRRGIWTSDGGTRDNFEVKWNEELIHNIVPSAYYTLLLVLKKLAIQGMLLDYQFYSLWPLKVHQPWNMLIPAVYSYLQSSGLFYSSSVNKWLTVNKSTFIARDILTMSSSTSQTPSCILNVVKYFQLPVVNLEEEYKSYLDVTSSTVTEEKFVNLFFEKIDILTCDHFVSTRNDVLCLMLEIYAMELDSNTPRSKYLELHLRKNPCVPCVPDGNTLRLCSSVIDGNATFASLFDLEESMFPIENIADRRLVDIALRNLGIISQYLPWSLLNERARTVQDIYESDRVKALNRTQGIIQCIEYTSKYDPNKTVSHLLSKIPFLPVMPKPNGYPLPWYGKAHSLVCGTEVVLEDTSHSADVVNIAGSQIVILNTKSPAEGGCGVIHITACGILKIQTVPTISNAIKQLQSLVAIFELTDATPSDDIFEWCDEICDEIYDFLTNQLHFKVSKESEKMISKLVDDRSIWTGKSFISPQVVAKDWRHETGPYLFKLPSQLATKKDLINLLGIKERFTLNDIVSALNRMKTDFEGKPVEQPVRAVLFSMIHEIDHIMAYTEGSNIGMIMLPDTTFVMHHACELSYNDAPWCKLDEKYTLVNVKVNRDLALRLGVRPVRSKMMDKYASKFPCLGAEFGQREELPRRIQNILREYPFDITVLKELLQNADDAKASKMWVILDKRMHTEEGILSDEWKNLQGPALLVWNDSTFSEEDLEGIQKLGLGSKQSEAESIGQYGIGFNVVYHLTDCPSFITAGKTLCVFDPHCCYVDGADRLNPGRIIDVTSGFWEDFPGIKSTFLRGGLQSCPAELMSGSLFRFPLRHTQFHIDISEILHHSDSRPLTARKMHKYLREWVPYMKQALLFLNNVKELQFCVIEETGTCLKFDCSFQVQLNDVAIRKRQNLHAAIVAFTQESGSNSCIERYTITTTECHSASMSSVRTECWLVQQGVGDICDKSAQWKYVNRVKPRHAIALQCGHGTDVDGEVFCFLPLPIKSNLPVHVNGHFFLDNSRRGLWISTQLDHVDERDNWNKNLLHAITSSYVNLLIHAREYFIMQQPDITGKLLDYYNIFPHLSGTSNRKPAPEGIWREVAENVYRRLARVNAPILAVMCTEPLSQQEHCLKSSLDSTPAALSARQQLRWCTIHCSTDHCSSQAHFFKVTDGLDELKLILQDLGMNIALVPSWIWECFYSVKVRIPVTDPMTVLQYYITYCHFADSPCHIVETPFHSVSNFKLFCKYITVNTEPNKFYINPFGSCLLVTADCMLQRFTDAKIIQSPYWHIFPQSKHVFLHAELLELNLKDEYFLTEKESERGFYLVDCIISKVLPPSLKARRLQNKVLKQSKLKEIWSCLQNDPVFRIQAENILKHWALLLSVTDELFSCPSRKCLLPVIMPRDDDGGDPMYHFLQQIDMPFLADRIITDKVILSKFCPRLQDHNWMLQNLFYLHQGHDFSHLLSTYTLEILMDYLRNINFKTNPDSIVYLYGLPIFEDVDMNFITLSGHKGYEWPSNVCSCGWKKWQAGNGISFLNPKGLWHRLGSAEDIGIQSLSAEDLYIKYIFPKFSKLNEAERYRHLKHIRDHMFELNIQRASDDHESAINFISALKDLPCIGNNLDNLKCVSEFYDHREEILVTFRSHFLFLPQKLYQSAQCYEEEKWMKFLCKLGLRKTVTEEMYLQLCTSVANEEQPGTNESSILLNYLFPFHKKNYTKYLHEDLSFLSRVSKIPFVHIDQVTELSWIASRCHFSGSTNGVLTTLSGAADHEHKTLLWTLRPIIQLPTNAANNYLNVLRSLDIATPTVSEVIANIVNISKSKLADLSLLDKYPDTYMKPNEGMNIIEALLHNYSFLERQLGPLGCTELQQLRSCQCIPVYADSKAAREYFMVLVKPNCVVTSTDAEEYFPLLHMLPRKMLGCAELLEKIGVMSTIGLTHFSISLSTVFEFSKGMELEPNMNDLVEKVIRKLYTMLHDKQRPRNPSKLSNKDIVEALDPLYLPTTKRSLCPSTSLLYCDAAVYNRIKIDLSRTELWIMSFPGKGYDFHEEDLCSLIPSCIRPRKMSQCCVQVISPGPSQIMESELARSLEESISVPSLTKTLLLIVGEITRNDDLARKFELFLGIFLKSIAIRSVNKLQTTILLTIVEPHREIGGARVDHHFQEDSDGENFTLYLDSELSTNVSLLPLQPIIEYLLSHIKQLGAPLENPDVIRLSELFKMAFQGKTRDDHIKVLQSLSGCKLSLDDDDIEFEADVQPRLGKAVPKTWYHRLDQDINNLFHSEEWVGYEDEEDHIVLVQVVCPVIPEGEIPSAIQINYKVLVTEDSEETIEVPSLNLFKFLKGGSIVGSEYSMALDVYERTTTSEDEHSNPRKVRKVISLKESKKIICQELKIIWKMPESERRRAIRRLYLKWHPDKNPDAVEQAEEMVKFLQCQVERLERGLPLEDTECEDNNYSSQRKSSGESKYSQWSSFYRQWDETANQHRYYSHSEERFHQSGRQGRRRGRRRGGCGADGGGWWGGGMGRSHCFDSENVFSQLSPNPLEGERWLRQATVDCEALCVLHYQIHATPVLAGNVCFLAHQVVEKALKGGKYIVCGLGDKGLKSHNLTDHAYALRMERPHQLQGLPALTAPLESYYLNTRYPNRVPPPQIPFENYTIAEADRAKGYAERVLELMRGLM